MPQDTTAARKLPFNHPDPIVRSFVSALSGARCRLRERHRDVGSIAVSRREVADYTRRLAELGVEL